MTLAYRTEPVSLACAVCGQPVTTMRGDDDDHDYSLCHDCLHECMEYDEEDCDA